MAGQRSRDQLKIAANAAVLQFRALRRIEDDYGSPWAEGQEPPPTDELEAALAAGDVNAIAKALPGVMQAALQQGTQQ